MTTIPNYPDTEAKIRGFKNLQPGWHYGEGDQIQQAVLDRALECHARIINEGLFDATDAFPGLAGEVMVTAYKADGYLEFIMRPDDITEVCAEIPSKQFMTGSYTDCEIVT